MLRRLAPLPTPTRNHIGVVRRSAATCAVTAVAWTWSHAGLLPALGVLAWLSLIGLTSAAAVALVVAERRRRYEWRLITARRHIAALLAERSAA